MLFPFDNVRLGQRQFYEDCQEAFSQGTCLLAYAPTGIGKTAGVLAAALEYAQANKGPAGNGPTGKGAEGQKKKIIFTTSRHSQHTIAVDTLKAIEERFGLGLVVVDIIGKQDMCIRDEAQGKPHVEFELFCAHERKSRHCPFARAKPFALEELRSRIQHVEEAKQTGRQFASCPHANASKLIREADVLICDYNYVFDSFIRGLVLKKMEVPLSEVILVVDEAHNLPERARSLLTRTLDKRLLAACRQEVKEYGLDPGLGNALTNLKQLFGPSRAGRHSSAPHPLTHEKFSQKFFSSVNENSSSNLHSKEKPIERSERLLGKEELWARIEEIFRNGLLGGLDFPAFIARLKRAEERANEKKDDEFQPLALTGLLDFFSTWQEDNPHMLRILRPEEITLFPLDPGDVTAPVFDQVHAAVLMSGTLYPPEVYADILGIRRRLLRAYPSPFPPENRLILASEILTTTYAKRGEREFRRLGGAVSELLDLIPDNVAVFFPSYQLLADISQYIVTTKQVLAESPDWDKGEKRAVVEQLQAKDNFALLGVQLGSFSEGIDFSGNALKGIVIVGVPLPPPSLERNYLVKYFDRKFGRGKGNEYVYMIPAVSKVLQSSGRGIRSGTDRCAVILLDERYNWHKYKQYFPLDFRYAAHLHMETLLERFFSASHPSRPSRRRALDALDEA